MFRDIIKKSGTYSVALLASRALGLFLLPLYTRYLTPGDYGVLELLDLTVNLAGILIGGRLGQALFYFYFSAGTEEEKDKCISMAFLCSLLLGCACAAIAVVGAPAIS